MKYFLQGNLYLHKLVLITVHQSSSNEAEPKNTKNPTTSVTVVKMTDPAKARSTAILSNSKGIAMPEKAATNILISMAIMADSHGLSNHIAVMAATTIAQSKPLKNATNTSLSRKAYKLDLAN
jgi:hypothetical protein